MNIYDFWQKHISKSYFLFKNILEERLNVKSNDLVLDFGCGTGKYCFLFNPEKYVGIDVDKKSIDIAKKKFGKYNFIQIKNNQLEFQENYFDLILILGVCHHINDQDLAIYLKGLYKVLKKKGKIMIIEPILSKTSTRLNKWMQFVDRGEHFRYEDDLLILMSKNFKVKEVDQFITEMFYNEKIYELTKIN